MVFQNWLQTFMQKMNDSRFAMQLFPRMSGGTPFVNRLMRATFGPPCDSPSPQPYIDPSTEAAAVDEVMTAVTEGRDCMAGVVCRTVTGGKPLSLLCVKGLRSSGVKRNPIYRWDSTCTSSILFLFDNVWISSQFGRVLRYDK